MRSILTAILLMTSFCGAGLAQVRQKLAPITRQFVSVSAPVVALVHVRVIDGTGAPPREDQTIVIDHGRIAAVGNAAFTAAPAGAKVLDLKGRTVIPGLVGMHDHLFYPSQLANHQAEGPVVLYNEMGFSFPRLYLACGVTTLRTTGSIEPYTDLSLKRLIHAGKIPGPSMYITWRKCTGSSFCSIRTMRPVNCCPGSTGSWMREKGITRPGESRCSVHT